MNNTNEILPLEISQPIKEHSNLNDKTSTKEISSLQLIASVMILPFAVKQHGNLTLTGFFDENNPDYPYIVIGPNYSYFFFALVVFMSYTFLFYYFMWRRANVYVNVLCLSLALLHQLLYFVVFMKNPGLVLAKPAEGDEAAPQCDFCHSAITPHQRQKHCETCNACFVGYDHHCPWTSKCVAGGNKTLFNCFLLLTLLQFVLPVFVILSFTK